MFVVTSRIRTEHNATANSPTTGGLTHRQAAGGDPRIGSAMAIVVAVLTYRRPAELATLLPELSRQASGRPAIRVLVVDNDPAASGEAVVPAASDPAIGYVHEPRPGIAAARNRALDESASDDVLIFIDDDEWPCETWLQSMLEVYDRTSSAAVVGPVISQYATEPEPWIKAGRFFDRRRLASGSKVDVAATNNLLLDLRQVRDFGLRFDEDFGLSGGSDTLFTRLLHQGGGTLIWCDEAIVVDQVPVPPQRQLVEPHIDQDRQIASRAGESAARVDRSRSVTHVVRRCAILRRVRVTQHCAASARLAHGCAWRRHGQRCLRIRLQRVPPASVVSRRISGNR